MLNMSQSREELFSTVHKSGKELMLITSKRMTVSDKKKTAQ